MIDQIIDCTVFRFCLRHCQCSAGSFAESICLAPGQSLIKTVVFLIFIDTGTDRPACHSLRKLREGVAFFFCRNGFCRTDQSGICKICRFGTADLQDLFSRHIQRKALSALIKSQIFYRINHGAIQRDFQVGAVDDIIIADSGKDHSFKAGIFSTQSKDSSCLILFGKIIPVFVYISIDIRIHAVGAVIAILIAVNEHQITQLVHGFCRKLCCCVFPALRLVQAKETIAISSTVCRLDGKLIHTGNIQSDHLRCIRLPVIVTAVE